MQNAELDLGLETLPGLRFCEIPGAALINKRLLAAFERENSAPDVRRTHHFGERFENTYIAHERLPELQPLRELVLQAAARILGREDLHHGFWFNEMQPGQRTSLHSHEELDELLSAVYYIKSPAQSGRLILREGDIEIAVTPRPGLLVLFPPDIPHEVEVNASCETRLSIAFNFGPRNSAT